MLAIKVLCLYLTILHEFNRSFPDWCIQFSFRTYAGHFLHNLLVEILKATWLTQFDQASIKFNKSSMLNSNTHVNAPLNFRVAPLGGCHIVRNRGTAKSCFVFRPISSIRAPLGIRLPPGGEKYRGGTKFRNLGDLTCRESFIANSTKKDPLYWQFYS